MIYVVDYQIPRSEEVDFFIIEATDMDSAERKAIEELKALNIPKRYLLNVEGI